MSRTAKIIVWSIIGLIIIGIIAYVIYWANNLWKKITFEPFFVSADLSGLTIKDVAGALVGKDQKEITVTMGVDVKNDNTRSIKFGNFRMKLSYKGIEMATTSDKLASETFVVPAKGEPNNPLPIPDTVRVFLNQGIALLITDKIQSKKPKVDYSIYLSVFGIYIPFPITGSFEW